ncbi:MoaD/ThiS family protein [Chthonobacter albigriseus]|uniref:MoaD/ThiS family protein n=1 Tax=Chthonobacter albigriseus TaxID=1683161 RepID=UPI0015EE6743|nr:MoaD/ThiS family protein [Chthonobacter albigriseus]
MSQAHVEPDSAPVHVRLPPAFANLFPDAPRRLEVHAATVSELFDRLDELWPGMRDRLCDTRPAIRRHINVFMDGERLTLASRLPPGSDVFVLTAVSGG